MYPINLTLLEQSLGISLKDLPKWMITKHYRVIRWKDRGKHILKWGRESQVLLGSCCFLFPNLVFSSISGVSVLGYLLSAPLNLVPFCHVSWFLSSTDLQSLPLSCQSLGSTLSTHTQNHNSGKIQCPKEQVGQHFSHPTVNTQQ